jgi:three-Cys-motif partner protein
MTGPHDWDEPLFSEQDLPPKAGHERPRRKKKSAQERLWTSSKARLIERYLNLFVLITKDGTYIDGFAGPQEVDKLDAWAARLVLESEPAFLKHFHLFEIEQAKAQLLDDLRRQHPDRDVVIYPDDVNLRIEDALATLTENEPTFCLLDQRTFECHWETVRTIAAAKAGARFKVEIFYFLAEGWLNRSIYATSTPAGLERVDAWWGDRGWDQTLDMHGLQRAELVAGRLRVELGYEFAVPYAIYERGGRGKLMYYMIHASDHPAAPELMDRAYDAAVRPEVDSRQVQLRIE